MEDAGDEFTISRASGNDWIRLDATVSKIYGIPDFTGKYVMTPRATDTAQHSPNITI